jgi:hypothetical protein
MATRSSSVIALGTAALLCLGALLGCSDGGSGGEAGAGGGAGANATGGAQSQGGSGASTASGSGGMTGGSGIPASDAGDLGDASGGGTGGSGEPPLYPPCEGTGMHTPNPQLAAIGENEAIDLGDFACTVPDGDDYDCAQVTDYSSSVYDCRNHRVLMFGGGHATTFTDTLFAFDFETLRWTELWEPTPCTSTDMGTANFDDANGAWRAGPSGPYPRPLSRHSYDLNVYLDTLDEYALLVGPNGDSGSCPPGSSGYDFANLSAHTAHYSFADDAWRFSTTATGDGHPDYGQGEYAAAELDPPSGSVVILGQYGLYVYDPITMVKTVVLDNYNDDALSGLDLGYARELVYFPPNEKHYYFSGSDEVWEVTLDRDDFTRSTVTAVATSGSAPSGEETGFAYDAVNRVIGGAVEDDTFHVFDPATAQWQALPIQGAQPGGQAFHAIDFDPVDGVFIFVGDDRHTYAYRYR